MRTYVSEEQNDDTAHDSASNGIGWVIPEDVLVEWEKLSEEELSSLSLVMNALLEEINNTLATTALNARLLPVAANELTKRLRDFRMSLKDMPFPKNSERKRLH